MRYLSLSLLFVSLLFIVANGILHNSLWMMKGKQETENCKDGVCSLPPPSTGNEDSDPLESKVLAEWKESHGVEEEAEPANEGKSEDENLSTTPIEAIKEAEELTSQPLPEQTAATTNETETTVLPLTEESNGNNDTSSSTATPSPLSPAVEALMKLGWTQDSSQWALSFHQEDLSLAASYLEEEEEGVEQLMTIAYYRWQEEAARMALREVYNTTAQVNLTAANDLLLAYEQQEIDDFSALVQEMVSSGWHEHIARQAILAQQQYERLAMQGRPVTIDKEVLEQIRPSYRLPPPKTQTTQKSQNLGKSNPDTQTATQKTPQTAASPTVKKEDVVFELSSASSLQQLVLDSPVPVLVDVYATWCGPCKQLTPLLEDIAMRGNGAIRLVKIDGDRYPGVVKEVFKVRGYPTVFAVGGGRAAGRDTVQDCFVGMIGQPDMKRFLDRVITGRGPRYCQQAGSAPGSEDYLSDDDLKAMSDRLCVFVGSAQLDGRKRTRLSQLVEAALEEPDAFQEGIKGSNKASQGMTAALKLIQRAREGLLDSSSTGSSPVQQLVPGSRAGRRLLEAAGFRSVEGSENDYRLVHRNPALLDLVSARAGEIISRRRFSAIYQTSSADSNSPAQTSASPTPTAMAKASKDEHTKQLPKKTTKQQTTAAATMQPATIEKKQPKEKKQQPSKQPSATSKKKKKIFTLQSMGLDRQVEQDKKKKLNKQQGKKEPEKFNEYFGGDSTVTLADNDDDEEEDEEVEEDLD